MRTKRVYGGKYYQLVESRRVDGKPRQRVLVHLGHHPTVDQALKAWPKEVKRLRRAARKDQEMIASWEEAAKDAKAYRNALKRAESTEKRAGALEANLQKLRDLRKRGVV